ncbi:MAG TPA: HU family DNA-binding protein [Pirellulales bacterium]|jgi:nucleoid DNA-binding protein|nr:HU family DNA-binding protein [Pirellulales bacterium]
MQKAAGATSAAKKAPTKSEVMNNIAEATSLSKKDVAAVFEALVKEIQKAMSAKGAGIFTIPGLVKVTKKKKPARPAQKGVKNPFTGELRDIPAKPASMQVKVRALKSLKEMV